MINNNLPMAKNYMKNYKKIIVGIFSFILLFSAQNAFAANWNSEPSDCQNTVAIANYTSNMGYGSCWSSTSMSAEPGDTINVRIYYHNTSKTVAKNVRLAITKTSGTSTSHNFTGRIMSDNGDLSGNVNLSVSSSQSISFVDARWFPNQSRTQASLPNGQSASAVLSNGISIGDVAPGWSSQGTMVAVFKVSSTVVPELCKDTSASNYNGALPCTYPQLCKDTTATNYNGALPCVFAQKICTISNFSASDYSITSGESSTLSWNTTNCTSATIYPTLGNVNTSGSKTVSPTSSMTYTLSVSGNGTSDTDTVTINVTAVPQKICTISNFSASDYSITSGESSTLSWNTTNCTSATIYPTLGNVTTSGSRNVSPTSNMIYTLTASGDRTTYTKTVTINVSPVPPQLCKDTTATNYNGALPCTYPPKPACVIDDFSASPTSIGSGTSSTLSWHTTNCTSTSISQLGNVNTIGYRTVYPMATTTYTLTASNSTGGLQTKNATVNVSPVPPQLCKDTTATNYNGALPCVFAQKICTISNFSASDYSITSGESSTLSWNTTNCTSATIYPTLGNVNTSGSKTVSPTSSMTYTLSVSGNGTSDTDTVTINVTAVPQKICTISNFSASDYSITSGESSTLSWNTTNCTSATIYPTLGNVTTSGSRNVSPTSNMIYTLTASGDRTTYTKTVTINVSPVPPQLCKDTTATNYNGALPCTYPPKPACVINSFSTSETSITSGDSAILSWNTSNCTSVTIYPIIGNTSISGSQVVSPTSTKIYTLTALGATRESQIRTVTISVDQPSVCAINNFSANPTSIITSGGSSVLSWSTSDCTSVSISPIVGSANTSGSEIVFPEQTTTYTLTARKGTSIAQTRAVTIYVEVPPQLCKDTSASNYNGALPCTYPQLCKDTSATNYNGALPCTYPQLLCRDINATNYNGALPCDYPSRICLDTTATNYSGLLPCQYPQLLCYDTNAINYQGALPCRYIEPSQCTISDFSASDLSIEDGDSTTLHWSTNNCEDIKISDIGYVSDDGSKKVSPDEDTTYILTAYDEDGSHQTDSVKIYVDEENNDDDNNSTCSIDSFTASNTYINRGDSLKLKWSTSDCDNVNISNVGEVDDDGTETVSPSSTITYILRAYGDNDESKSIQVRVNYNQVIQPVQIYNTNVVTTIATNISQTGAQVNGLITSSDYNNSNVYFEYGTTINMGMRTASRSTNGNTNFSEYLTNLSPKTIYYFQALSEGSNGVSRGAIEVFQTVGYPNVNTNTSTRTNTIIKEVVVQGATVYGSTSPLILEITDRYQSIGIGDLIDYTVYYKNISSSRLTNPMVQVYVPSGITITNVSNGTYSEDERTLSVPINDLNPGEEGHIYLQARVDTLSADLAQVVTTAILVYTNPNGAQENAMAYVLNNPKINNSNLLGASAFFGGIFNFGLIGWLIIIILIMLILLIARSYNNRRNVTTTKTEKTISQ